MATGRELITSIINAAATLQDSDDSWLDEHEDELKEVDDTLWQLVDD